MTPLISFAITTHNEGEYVQELLNQLIPYCEKVNGEAEIVIVDDFSTDEFTLSILNGYEAVGSIQLYQHHLNNDFATHKNFLNSKCTGEYIFQIDADETLHSNLLTYLIDVVDNNKNIDLFFVPRINIVNGLTEDDVRKWGWQVNELGWVMFPDYQTRLYKNSETIKWEGKVHERIVGHKTQAPFPAEEEWALRHIKEINRQREQNKLYETIQR
jgi:glycosyltransferase involved in cell wall biosynthesis